MINNLILLLIISALVACTGFIGMYATRAPWHRTDVGRTMMILALGLVLNCVSGLTLSLFPGVSWFPYLRLVLWGSLNIGLWRQLRTLIQVQRAADAQDEDQDKTPVA